MRAACICVLLMSSFCSVAESQTWSTIQPGIERIDGKLSERGGESVAFVLLRCDPRRNSVRVIDTYHELKTANAYSAFSLREIGSKTGAAIVVNAGSTTSYTFPAPAGLLMAGSKVIHAPSYSSREGVGEGIFCIAHEHLSIVAAPPTGLPKCADAVQRGPLLKRDSLSDTKTSGERHRRTVVALDNVGRLLIIVTKEGATLSSISNLLYTSNINLGTVAALNMDGDSSSGLLIVAKGKPEAIGSVDGLVASAIAIYTREQRHPGN